MRRVRNYKSSNTSPLAMFSVGIEQIVSDHMLRQPEYDDQELRAMQRSPKKEVVKGNLFSDLFKLLFWDRVA